MTGDRERVAVVTIHQRDRLFVDAVLWSDGSVGLEGQDLRGDDELEYFFTIAPADVPALVAALDGRPGADPLALLRAHGDALVSAGEMHWLQAHGVPFTLSTW
ncbi:hypothetical protein [Nocardioides sp. SYSU D00038]|uniref:hypothetical protein n=1 Tax=Nocardioides sp. SYSU D00038 TaxID=2812554 RepID=UPI001966E11D|nr:hypothetical protein [Nocardioides sp. SYSU D00038]